jgi:hypothetical protein
MLFTITGSVIKRKKARMMIAVNSPLVIWIALQAFIQGKAKAAAYLIVIPLTVTARRGAEID